MAVNLANLQNGTGKEETPISTRARLRFVREYRMHGAITGLQRIQTIDTARDGLDRLLVSFKHAKVGTACSQGYKRILTSSSYNFALDRPLY